MYIFLEKKNAKLAGLPFDHVATISEVVTEQPPSGYTSVLLQPPSWAEGRTRPVTRWTCWVDSVSVGPRFYKVPACVHHHCFASLPKSCNSNNWITLKFYLQKDLEKTFQFDDLIA